MVNIKVEESVCFGAVVAVTADPLCCLHCRKSDVAKTFKQSDPLTDHLFSYKISLPVQEVP